MTPIAAVAASATELRRIELWQLRPSEFNPRKTHDPAALAELEKSIRTHGIQVPILCRPLPDSCFRSISELDCELFQIVAGSRRHAALANIEPSGDALCIVREMSDDEAREIALVDNLQREDMPALEEADAYEALRQQLGDAERIAARVGKPIEYIAKRLKLVALGDLERVALAARLITVDHALLLARLGPEDQDVHLKWALDVNAGVKTKLADVIIDVTKRMEQGARGGYRGYWEPQSVLDLKHHIENHAGRALSKAPWDLDDAELVPAAGACSCCPSNTAHNTSLFDDLSIRDATCEDGKCFEAKRERFVQIKLDHAKVDDGSLTKWIWAAKLSYKISEAKPPMSKEDSKTPNITRVLRYGQWIDVKAKSCPYVRKGVTVDWEDGGYRSGAKGKPGITKLVCIVEGCKVHPKSYEKKAQQLHSGDRHDSAAEKAREENNKQKALAENKLRIAFVSAALEGVTAIQAAPLRVIVFEALPGWEERLKVYNALLPGLVKLIQTAPINSPEFAKALALASIDGNVLQVSSSGYSDDSKDRRAELIKAVRGLGYTGPDPWSEAKPAPKKAPAKKAVPAKKAAVKKAVKKAAKPTKKNGGGK